MDYKSTLNLPNTKFSMKADLPAKEPARQAAWEDMRIYEKIREIRRGKDKFVLHDGPPYANGHIHMGHVLNKILKDIVVKFATMRGYDSPYIPGWDCHGLPVEHQLFKELKIKKGDIDRIVFRKKAREYAMKFVAIQRDEFRRLGIFGDWDNPYLTLAPAYESHVIRAFASLVKEGYIYKDLKPVNWCTTCETALAEAEVEYEDRSSPSIYVKFRSGWPDTYFVIWTTTPWTLMANVAIAVHPDLEYAVCETGGEKWIILAGLADHFFKKTDRKYTVIKKVKGGTFSGSTASHPFLKRDGRVVCADYVSRDEGTGAVHTAPGHGQEDYLTGKKYNLPIIMPVDVKGMFDDTCLEFSGMNVHDANERIIEKMRANGSLILAEKISHSYPHCWRCKRPIIFRATEQWFMRVDHRELRKRILKSISKDVKWHPEAGITRISSMVENRPDWCLSRQRYWGVPIPAFYCRDCGERILDHMLIEKLADIVMKDGVDVWFSRDMRELLPENYTCPKCGRKNIDRESDILDVWFESGVSHQAVLKPDPALDYPCGLYLEGSDQHRGWFQSAIITSMAIDDKAPYREVLTHGFIVDGEGKKMSKSLGNVVSPQDLMKKYGADILRLWVSSSNYTDDVRLSDEIIKRTADAYRKIRNTFRFLLSNLSDFDPKKDVLKHCDLDEVDRWMLSRLGHLREDVTLAYSSYTFHKAYRSIYSFCVYEVSSLYLDIVKDRLYTFAAGSGKRRSAQTVIYFMLDCLVRMLAPILPFTCEEVWEYLVLPEKERSVHLSAWPEPGEDIGPWIDPVLENKWESILSVRETVQKALEQKRAEGVIGSSLDAKVILSVKNAALKKALKDSASDLPAIFIVSQVEISDGKDGSGTGGFSEEAGIRVGVCKAAGAKCARCWIYSGTVGENKNHPNICKKCADNI